MRVAIVGTGISGLVCARLLSRAHDVTVFEAGSRVGGHTNTVTTEVDGQPVNVDAGFIVYNERNYPFFKRILADLGVETDPTAMSFAVRCDRTGIEYNGSSLNGLFAQRRNLLRPSFLRLLKDIVRFNREGTADRELVSEDQTVGEYLRRGGYSREFADQYLLPMGAAIWSCPVGEFAEFPMRFILDFYHNHGLMQLRDRPVWRVIRGGSNRYVERLIEPFKNRIRLNCGVTAVTRCADSVRVRHSGTVETFDEAVLACHADQAQRLLTDCDELETSLLNQFPYSRSTAVLHTDESVLPRRRLAWACWNYHVSASSEDRPTVTYHMNLLQHLRTRSSVLVTLNEQHAIDPDRVLATFQYEHPVFSVTRAATQARHGEVIRRRRTSFCGAYWRNGFHEDGVVSALAVCREFGINDWSKGE